MMLLTTVRIEHFRGLAKVEVDLSPTTVLIGENNSGKTSFLDALRVVLMRSPGRKGFAFDGYDYHLANNTAEAQTAPPISITLVFRQKEGTPLAEEFTRALGDALVTDKAGTSLLLFRVTSAYDSAAKDFVTDWNFLNPAGDPLGSKAHKPQLLNEFLRLFPVFYLTAFRDAVREFRTGNYWTPFIRNPVIPEDIRESLQDQISDLNEAVLQAHTSFQTVKTHLAKVQEIIPLGQTDVVDIEALPGRISDLLASTQVSVKAATGAAIPLTKHGAGTQSLSVLFLFQAFLSAMLEQQYDALSAPILAMEEPEAHLHPCAIRSVWSALEEVQGQKIIATHSGDMIAHAPLTAIRRFHSRSGSTRIGVVPNGHLSPEEDRRVRYHIASTRGELLFARCWLLYEGESEHWLLEGIARTNTQNLEKYGVRLVPYSFSGHEPLLKVAKCLGIPWLLLADGDGKGNATVKGSVAYLDGANQKERIIQFAEPTIEFFLCKNGFGATYEAHISPQKKGQVTSKQGTDQYWKEVLKAQDQTPKPDVIQEVVKLIEGGSAAPKLLVDLINNALRVGGA